MADGFEDYREFYRMRYISSIFKGHQFKTVVFDKNENHYVLEYAEGEVCWIRERKFFLYYNEEDRLWFMVDAELGCAFATAKTRDDCIDEANEVIWNEVSKVEFAMNTCEVMLTENKISIPVNG